jgi:hypothetical protein
MTETQGTTALGPGAAPDAPNEGGRASGAAGTSTNPVDAETETATVAAGRPVGRATVPATETPAPDAAPPRYTRAPGMPPPPDAPTEDAVNAVPVVTSPASVVTASATVPVVTAAVPVAPPVSAPPSVGTSRPGGVATGRVSVGSLPGRALGAGAGVVGAARVSEAVRTARASSSAAAARGPRRARLTVKRVDPWSVMKFSFAVSLVLFIVIIVATSVLYLALDAMGVFDSVNSSLTDVLASAGGQNDGGTGFKITAKGVIGTSALLGAVNVVLVTALATLSAFIYNVCADLVGGVELTLSERD